MGLGMQVGVYYHGFREIHLVASSKHMFSNCWGWHILRSWEPVGALPGNVLPVCLMYVCGHSPQGMLYTTPFLCFSGTGSFGGTSSCFKVRKGRKVTLNGQGAQYSADWLWQAMDVGDSHWCPCYLFLIPWDWLWETVPYDESDRVFILLDRLLYATVRTLFCSFGLCCFFNPLYFPPFALHLYLTWPLTIYLHLYLYSVPCTVSLLMKATMHRLPKRQTLWFIVGQCLRTSCTSMFLCKY